MAASSKGEMARKLEQIKWVGDEIREVQESIKSKEAMRVQLTAEVEQIKQDKPRAYYTQRILDIVSKITRQKAEIEKVCSHIRLLFR